MTKHRLHYMYTQSRSQDRKCLMEKTAALRTLVDEGKQSGARCSAMAPGSYSASRSAFTQPKGSAGFSRRQLQRASRGFRVISHSFHINHIFCQLNGTVVFPWYPYCVTFFLSVGDEQTLPWHQGSGIRFHKRQHPRSSHDTVSDLKARLRKLPVLFF